jgi:hypothetical protein
MIARLNTRPEQPPSAWITRPTISTGSDHAAAHSTVPARKRPSPHSNTGRRPNRSDTGP